MEENHKNQAQTGPEDKTKEIPTGTPPAEEEKKDAGSSPFEIEELPDEAELKILPPRRDLDVEAAKKEEERLKKISAMLPDEFHAGPKKASRSRMNLIKITFFVAGALILFTVLVMAWLINHLKNEMISSQPIEHRRIVLSLEEETDLANQMSNYHRFLAIAGRISKPTDFKIVLTGQQLNSILEELGKNKATDGVVSFFIQPSGENVELSFSTLFSQDKYLNVIMNGKMEIKDYVFSMDTETFRIGNIKESRRLKERTIERINGLLKTEPKRMNAPFRVKNLYVDRSLINITLTIEPQGGQPGIPNERRIDDRFRPPGRRDDRFRPHDRREDRFPPHDRRFEEHFRPR
jgi:hypothetical protein